MNSRRFSVWHTIYHIGCKSRESIKSSLGSSPPRSAAEQIRRDLLAGIDQALNGADRLVEGLAVLARKIDLDDALDALGADHHGHADIHVLHAVLAVEIGS